MLNKSELVYSHISSPSRGPGLIPHFFDDIGLIQKSGNSCPIYVIHLGLISPPPDSSEAQASECGHEGGSVGPPHPLCLGLLRGAEKRRLMPSEPWRGSRCCRIAGAFSARPCVGLPWLGALGPHSQSLPPGCFPQPPASGAVAMGSSMATSPVSLDPPEMLTSWQ